MIASELAGELSIDPSIMSKRLQVYHAETGESKTRLLTPQTVADMRHAHELLTKGQASTFKIAVQMALGTFTAPVPPESVKALESRLERLEKVQDQTLDRVTRTLRYIEALVHQEAGLDQQSGQ